MHIMVAVTIFDSDKNFCSQTYFPALLVNFSYLIMHQSFVSTTPPPPPPHVQGWARDSGANVWVKSRCLHYSP